ncbi:Cys-tRNA(Pro) deacylase [uncultured Bartonella sp.]|uniref:Cys-tRNA(Pro) deacylase n=1 Tax=uncultured Bartonella sp. TaxID=104108 RepID=UPI002639EDBF|nr:Cys-tRNA(Pro) deacylase [uncultured Bartonella sp.]
MSKTTPATAFLDHNHIEYEFITYQYDSHADRVGLQAAEAVGADPDTVFKTLMVKVDGKPHVAVLPADQEANMKKLAAAFGGKHAEMLTVEEAEKLTGYKVGGISPFGQRRHLPTVFEKTAELYDKIYINGGGRGFQVKMSPQDAIRVISAKVADFKR